jgi:hypothetical protein
VGCDWLTARALVSGNLRARAADGASQMLVRRRGEPGLQRDFRVAARAEETFGSKDMIAACFIFPVFFSVEDCCSLFCLEDLEIESLYDIAGFWWLIST